MKRNIVVLLFLFGFSIVSNTQNLRIGDFKIEGNKKIKSSFLKKIASIRPQTVLDSSLIENDIIQLKRLESVSHAYYKVSLDQDNTFNVTYIIEENFTLIPTLNVYTTDDGEFAYKTGLYDYNTLGRNITFGGFYLRDVYDSFAINFRAPFLFSKHMGLAFNIQDLTILDPIFFNEFPSNYNYNNKSAEVLGLYQFNLNNRLELGFNYFTETYTYKSGLTNENIPQALKAYKWMLKGIYDFNKLDFHYQYVTGFRNLTNVQSVQSSNNALPSFIIAWNDFLFFKRIKENGNWASRLHLGLSTNHDIPFAPFSVDNNLNIRGVGNTIDKGTGIFVLNTEYRYTLYEKNWFVLQGNGFVDAGAWRQPGGNFSNFIDTETIRIYPGLGLRFIHKKIFNAIFRLDYGYGVTKDATKGLVFGIGQYF